MDDDISEILKDIGALNEKYKKCEEEKNILSNQLKLLKNNCFTIQNAEKSQNKLIAEQQAIISKLVNDKEEKKSFLEEISKKNKELEEEKSILFVTYQQDREKLIQDNYNKLENIQVQYESEVHGLKSEIEKLVQEFNQRIEEIHENKDQQINSLINEHEKQLQSAHIQAMRMRSEFKTQHDLDRRIILTYKNRIEELEKNDKLLQSKGNNCSVEFFEQDLILNEINSINSVKGQKPFHIISKNEVEIDELPSTNFKQSKATKRKLFNRDMEFLDE